MLFNDWLSVNDKPKISWQLFLTLCQRIGESSLCLKYPSHFTLTKTGSLPHSFQSSIAPKHEHNMGALRETPREVGLCSPGSPRFHFTFHFRIHFHKNLLFKCTCEAEPIILTKRWGDSDLLRGGQRMASKQTSTIWSWVPIPCLTPQGSSVKAGFVCYKTKNRSINEK